MNELDQIKKSRHPSYCYISDARVSMQASCGDVCGVLFLFLSPGVSGLLLSNIVIFY